MKPNRLYFLFLWIALVVQNAAGQAVFIPNKGQWEKQVLFKANLPSGNFFIEKNKITYQFWDSKVFENIHEQKSPSNQARLNCFAYFIEFEGASKESYTETANPTSEYYNYFLGNNSEKWVSQVFGARTVFVRGLYTGIDLELYSEGNSLKYNFIVAPGADVSQIKMKFQGQQKLNLVNGELIVNTSLGKITEQAPVSYLENASGKTALKSKYELNGNTVTFQIENHPSFYRLVIDPKVVFSTYSASLADNWGFTGTYDDLGNGYSGGTVYDIGYPVTFGAFQRNFAGGQDIKLSSGDLARDAGILKYNPMGTALLFATYLGGSHNEQPQSMVVNNAGELCVFGTTWSVDFPISTGAFDDTHNGKSDIYVVKFNATGTQLLASTFIGGSERDGLNGTIENGYPNPSILAYNYGDLYRGEIIVDNRDNIYFASTTESSDGKGLPISGGFQTSFGGGVEDGCVFKLTPNLDGILWSSYLGGNAYDAAYALALDVSGNLFVTGGTSSSGWSASSGGWQTNYQGGPSDGYIARINASGGNLTSFTFIGTDRYNQSYFVQTDKYGSVYVYGQTEGAFPLMNTTYRTPNSGQFIQVYSNDLKTLQRSMTFGSPSGKPNISPSAFLVDKCDRIFVSGWGGAVNDEPRGHNGNTRNMAITQDAFQKTTDGSDFYLAVFSKNFEQLLYATYFGGVDVDEHVDGGTSRFDKNGIIYQSVCGGCGGSDNFPTTPGAWSRVNRSDNCNNALFKIDFENLNRAPIARDTVLTVTVLDTLNYLYKVYDDDIWDSLYTDFTGNIVGGPGAITPLISITNTSGVGTVNNLLYWIPGCNHSNDTFTINVTVRDVGCPDYKSTTAKIKIFVKPPPVPDPPQVICLTFIDNNTIKIVWDKFQQNKYISHYLLYKKVGNNTPTVIDTFRFAGVPEFIDNKAFNYKVVDHCYFMVGVNICNEPGKPSYDACSLKELLSPIDSSYVYTATVVNNKNVKVVWRKTDEKDFASYMIYKKENNSKALFEFYKSISNRSDTVFIDTLTTVSSTSYCYKIVVADNCGHVSAQSNMGCTIVLAGNASPFEHNLSWSNYEKWQGGVDKYVLYRKDDGHPYLSKVITTPTYRAYKDEWLDYDWGGYWYYVQGFEGTNGQNATSESNEVYLVQPPLLHVPNAFTSNGDRLNDTWGIVPVFVKEYRMQVYNRWGQKIFETDDKKNDWEGFVKGLTPNDNVFIWQVVYTGWDEKVYNQKGTITLLN